MTWRTHPRTDNGVTPLHPDEITTYTDDDPNVSGPWPGPPVRVDIERSGGEAVLAVAGVLDVVDADLPVEAVSRVLAEDPPRRLVVDLAAVTFMGSGGIGSLVRIRTLCHEAGVPLTLRGVRRPARKLLVVTGLDKVFEVAPDTPS